MEESILKGTIIHVMLESHLSIAREQAEKKLDWDETVLAKHYVWHPDVLMAEMKLASELRPSVLVALESLHQDGLLRRLSLENGVANFEGLGQATLCYAVPLESVLGQMAKPA